MTWKASAHVVDAIAHTAMHSHSRLSPTGGNLRYRKPIMCSVTYSLHKEYVTVEPHFITVSGNVTHGRGQWQSRLCNVSALFLQSANPPIFLSCFCSMQHLTHLCNKLPASLSYSTRIHVLSAILVHHQALVQVQMSHRLFHIHDPSPTSKSIFLPQLHSKLSFSSH